MTHTITHAALKRSERNAEARKQRILTVLHQVITEKGLTGSTIHEVAQTSGIAKTEINRQFGTLADLLEAYVENGYFIPLPPDGQTVPLPHDHAAEAWYCLSQQLVRHWRASKASREILLSCMHEPSSRLMGMEQARNDCFERFASQLIQMGTMLGGDERACLAIILGGLNFLMMQAHLDQPFLGIDLRSEAGWARIERAMFLLYHRLEPTDQ